MGSLFSFDVYRNNLQTRILGNVVLYAEVLPTTMDVFDGWDDSHDFPWERIFMLTFKEMIRSYYNF